MLTKLKLKNIKCFDRLDFDLSNLNILTGINGSGKSTFIQSLLMAEQSSNDPFLQLNGNLTEIGQYSDLLHEAAEEEGISVSIEVNGKCYSWGYLKDVDLPMLTAKLPRIGNNENFPGFKNFFYISAERWGPRNNVPLNLDLKNRSWPGKHGEFTIPVLGILGAGVSSVKNEKEESLAEEDPRLHKKKKSNLILRNIIDWMGEVSPNVDIQARMDTEAMIAFTLFGYGKEIKYRATNVGFGLSYALSIVTTLLVAEKGDLVILENPEAHLHPQGQSKLGQLIGLASKAGVQIIIETHSEHIINGARILVRKNILSASEMNILYFTLNHKEKKSNCEKLTVNEIGQISKWPEGFFDQQTIDMKTLITGE